MEVLDADRMRRADDRTIRGLKVPGLLLMENAGRMVAETVVEELDPAPARVLVVAGRGHNGGDGFVVARHLARMKVRVDVLLVGARRIGLEGDPRTMAEAWHGLGGATLEIEDEAGWARVAPRLDPGDAIVDALFGTGLARPLAGLPAAVVAWINRQGRPVVAVDLPSGLFASSPGVPGPAVRADVTVTFARPKPAHLLPPAEDLCGDVVVADIGIPDGVVRETEPDLHWVTDEEAALLVPERDADDHKGRFGHVLVVAGATGRAGAAALTGWAALRGGAGLVTVATPAPARAEVAAFAAELMTEPLPSTREGRLARGAADAALELAHARSVLALGPGLGQDATARAEIRRMVARSRVPVVLDADGLNAFAGRAAGQLARRRAPLVLTPHPGEAARLAGVEAAEIQADRLGWARRLAAQSGAICLLKGYRTIVAAPDGMAFINTTGNPGMASGGMGDALTGLIAAFLAQGLEPLDAAVLGAHVHGLAADLALELGETEPTLTASTVIRALPAAFRALDAALDDEGAEGGGAEDDDA